MEKDLLVHTDISVVSPVLGMSREVMVVDNSGNGGCPTSLLQARMPVSMAETANRSEMFLITIISNINPCYAV